MQSRNRFAAPALVLPLLFALQACSTTSPKPEPQMALNDKFGEGTTTSNGNVTTRDWWSAFSDSRLNALVGEGIAQNLDIQQALERINSAQANVVVSTSGGLPNLAYSASTSTSDTQTYRSSAGQDADRRTTSTAGLNFSWLLDFFGRYEKARESALASLDEAHARADVARLSLLSQLVSAYIDLRFYQHQLSVSRKELASRRETLNLTRVLRKSGMGTELDIVQAEGLVNSTQTRIPGLEIGVRRAGHRIGTLLGRPASDLLPDLQKYSSQPVAGEVAQAGIPADLIRNRPDIRAAERRLAAAVAEIGVAEAQLYPSITLGGSISPSFSLYTKSPNLASLAWSFGPTLNLPIFDGGRLKANLSGAESTARGNYLAWKATVLQAIEEVENALAAVRRDAQTVAAARSTLRTYQKAFAMATMRYRMGESSLLDVLDAQRSVSDAERGLAEAIRQMALDYVALNVAIGSGYVAVPPATTTTVVSARPASPAG